MTGAGALLGAALGLPLVMLLACLSPRLKARMPALLALAPVPALAAALLASGGTLALPPVLLRIRLALDVPGALLLGVAALLWIAAGFYATAWLRGRPDAGRFAVWWLLTLTGSLGVFMAADLVSFYLVFSMVSLAAYGLIVDDGTPRARRYGLIYVALAVLGEAFLLMAFVLLAAGHAGRQPADPDAVASAVGIALARFNLGSADPRLRGEDRPRAVPCVDAACLSCGADSGGGRAQRCRGEGRCDRVDPLPAAGCCVAGMG